MAGSDIRADEPLRVLAQNLLHRFDASRQTEALERAVYIAPRGFKARRQRGRRRHGNFRHGVALLCGFDTPSLTAQGGRRLPSYFNITRDIPGKLATTFLAAVELVAVTILLN